MARRNRDQSDGVVQITPNQVVAFNLAEARALRGWTQEEAAAELERYLGARWSKATFSAAERSIDGRRVRQFTADEIVAFSRCFRVPVSYFFMPPRPSQSETPLRLESPENRHVGITLAELVDAIFGAPVDEDVMSDRLRRYLQEVDMGALTDVQDRLAWRAEDAMEAVVTKELARFDEWREALTDLASQLRTWQNAARAAAVRPNLTEEASDG
jgi:transcriptional regulator with XRE-family HTH domain